MIGRLPSLARSESGNSIVEMGFVAPILASLLIGMVDLSRAYSNKLQIEQIAQRTIEKVQNAEYSDTDAYKNALKAEAAAAAGVATSAVTVTSWLECNNDGVKLAFGSSCTDANAPFGRYVEVGIQRVYTPMFKVKFGGQNMNANGTYNLKGTAGVRIQ